MGSIDPLRERIFYLAKNNLQGLWLESRPQSTTPCTYCYEFGHPEHKCPIVLRAWETAAQQRPPEPQAVPDFRSSASHVADACHANIVHHASRKSMDCIYEDRLSDQTISANIGKPGVTSPSRHISPVTTADPEPPAAHSYLCNTGRVLPDLQNID